MSSLSSVSATTPVSPAEDVGGGGRGGDPEHRPTVGAELLDRGGEGGGLAGAGRADDQHQIAVSGDRRRGLRLDDGQRARRSATAASGWSGPCGRGGGRPSRAGRLPGRGWLGW